VTAAPKSPPKPKEPAEAVTAAPDAPTHDATDLAPPVVLAPGQLGRPDAPLPPVMAGPPERPPRPAVVAAPPPAPPSPPALGALPYPPAPKPGAPVTSSPFTELPGTQEEPQLEIENRSGRPFVFAIHDGTRERRWVVGRRLVQSLPAGRYRYVLLGTLYRRRRKPDMAGWLTCRQWKRYTESIVNDIGDETTFTDLGDRF
jgi:hypothetical protein